HDYERTFLLNGHYGTSTNLTSAMILNHGDGRADGNGAYEKPAILTPNKGAVYIVSGSAGQTEAGRLNHPAMYVSLKKLGSLVIDIDGLTAEVRFIGDRGQVRDYFTLRKK
ncbi:MAG TPA: metallophosphoesterase, partial [Candidatus Limnocylindria bacterium]|nr:metallophosphoesterase [Candidatus Limnocylindria bacterium]